MLKWADKLSSSFVILHESGKDTDQLELYANMQKFYSGDVNEVTAPIGQHDTIIFAPSKILKPEGAEQQGAQFLCGVFAGTFTPSKKDRMASFGAARENLSLYTGPTDLYAIFLE